MDKIPLPRVYADFNPIEYPLGSDFAEMPLTGFGTLSSLARQRLRLLEGMEVLLFEPNDIECKATVHFDRLRVDPAGRQGEWVARFDPSSIQTLPLMEEPYACEHPCIVCDKPFFGEVQSRTYNDTCINCGASVMEPMLPPDSET